MQFNYYDPSISATLECEIVDHEDYQELRSIKLNGVDLGAWFPDGCDKEFEIFAAYDKHLIEMRTEAAIDRYDEMRMAA